MGINRSALGLSFLQKEEGERRGGDACFHTAAIDCTNGARRRAVVGLVVVICVGPYGKYVNRTL